MKIIMLCFVIIASVALNAQIGSIFFSGINPEDELGILVQSTVETGLLVKNSGVISEVSMLPYLDFVGWHSTQFSVPDYPFLGFRLPGEDPVLNPIFWNQPSSPAPADLSLIQTDSLGDGQFSQTNLDILAYHTSFSDSKLYFGIQNNGGGFPTGSGLTFFSYMAVLVDPNADPEADPIVFGLMYTVNLPGVIGPGLYKITGTGISDLTNIGSIETQIDTANNLIVLSCNISDLLADPDFSSWYNPQNPLFVTQAITSKISLSSGNQTADSTDGYKLLNLPRELETSNANIPVLSTPELVINEEDQQFQASVCYSDADQNFPLVFELVLANRQVYPLHLLSEPDFSLPRDYESSWIPLPEDWSSITLRFSDNQSDYAEHSFYPEVSNPLDALLPCPQPVTLHPNPSTGLLRISDARKLRSGTHINIHNLKGQIVHSGVLTPDPDSGEYLLDVSSLSSGMYFLEVYSPVDVKIGSLKGPKKLMRFIKL
ncbi:MAG: T9SS type A sorting domain-containing protein [Candidatus Cloacimonetes bacterium]|nr:T9SS type A sorting domain-containing protein [Candidatus Cloacimonadota bacterium]